MNFTEPLYHLEYPLIISPNVAFPLRYGYRLCEEELGECVSGTVTNLATTTKTFTKTTLSPCTAYTACFSKFVDYISGICDFPIHINLTVSQMDDTV